MSQYFEPLIINNKIITYLNKKNYKEELNCITLYFSRFCSVKLVRLSVKIFLYIEDDRSTSIEVKGGYFK